METSAISSLATEMATARTQQAAQLAVLKQAMDLHGQNALQLVTAATRQTYNNPQHLGKNIDVFA